MDERAVSALCCRTGFGKGSIVEWRDIRRAQGVDTPIKAFSVPRTVPRQARAGAGGECRASSI